MYINRYLSQLFNTTIIATKTNLGLTNDVYFFHHQNQVYVVNVPNPTISSIIRDNNFPKVLQLIKPLDIDVEEYYFDEVTGVRITKFIESKNFKEYSGSDKYTKAIQIIKKLHLAKLNIGIEFNIIKKYHSFKKQIQNPLMDFESFEFIFDELKKINNPKVLCHNDIVEGNLLYTADRVYLIDFEYAKDNDPLFDIMSFITENNINDDKIREEIFKEYFGNRITDKIRYELHVYEKVHHLLWAAWANMMFDIKKDLVYLNIFQEKKEMLEKLI